LVKGEFVVVVWMSTAEHGGRANGEERRHLASNS